MTASRKHLKAAFDSTRCRDCPFFGARCPVDPGKQRQHAVLRFSQRQIDVARRRQRCAAERANAHHLRPAIEATVRSVKHPFPNGKLPVRGRSRVSMMLVGTCAMTNVRRIHRYLRTTERPDHPQRSANHQPPPALTLLLRTRSARETALLRLTHWSPDRVGPRLCRLAQASTS